MRKLLDVASFLAVVAMVVIAIWFYVTTDEIAVPMHWNAVGDVDSYGKTWTILVLAGVGVLVYLLLLLNQWLVTRDVPFTVPNSERVRPYAKMLSAWVTFLTSLLLLYVVGAVAQLYPLEDALVWADVAALCVLAVCFALRARRH